MRLTEKKVPARNIIGKVIRLLITAAVSDVLVTVPTSMPRDAKSAGPRIRNGNIQIVRVILAPKTVCSYAV